MSEITLFLFSFMRKYRSLILEALQPAPNRWHTTALVERGVRPCLTEAFDAEGFESALGWLVDRGLVEKRHNAFSEVWEYRLSESGKHQQGVA